VLAGDTIFAGDSITVGLVPFVKVDGAKLMIAEGGKDSAWLLGALRGAERAGVLRRYRNLVVLIGTNDLGGGASSTEVFARIAAIWALGEANGLRVLPSTIPPVKGWPPFARSFDAVNAKRKEINARIVAAAPSDLVRSDLLLADPTDPDRLAPSVDSGDHLHPRKDVHGAILSRELGASSAPNGARAPSFVVPSFVFVGLAALAGVLVWLRKEDRL
jgi:lysophospholipase L1-like esterase